MNEVHELEKKNLIL